MSLKEKAEKLNREISAVFVAMKHPDTPLYAKIAAGLCVAYALSPIDLIPDFIPVLGYLDDLLILPFLIWLAIKMTPEDVYAQCLEESEKAFREGGEKKLIYALPVVIIWVAIILAVVRVFLIKKNTI